MTKQLATIGTNAKIDFVGHVDSVPAKIDTGADSSSVWVSDVVVTPEHVLEFKLFGPSSSHYTGETLQRTAFQVAQVKSSNGKAEIRFRTQLTVRLGGKKIRAYFNLSNRGKNQFPVLIGRRTLAGKFLVDVKQKDVKQKLPKMTGFLNEELKKNPHKFYQKYHQNKQK